MIQVGVGPEGTESVLAQVCVVNEDGAIIYAKYVAPQEAVTGNVVGCAHTVPRMCVSQPDPAMHVLYRLPHPCQRHPPTPPCWGTDVRRGLSCASGTRAGCAHGCDHCSLLQVQKDVAALLKGRILVGHAVFNDLKVLMLDHPRTMTRDTAFFPPFCKPPRRPVRMLVCRHY